MHSDPRAIIITLDGYSSCGKSTLARALARRLQYIHIDSGAMYRAVTLHFLRQQVDIHDPEAVDKALEDITINLRFENDMQITWLNHENVETAIREPEINEMVSHVAALSAVRRAMVAQQRRMGERKGIVMDGRDIGTVVFPNAALKIFLIADLDVRVERRWLEMTGNGIDITREAVRENLLERDRIDTTRDDSPLIKAEDAIVIDNSYLTPEEQLQIAFDLARSVIARQPLDV